MATQHQNGPDNNVTYGWELIMDLHDCSLEIMSSAADIQRYAKEICREIDMKPYGEPQTPYFGEKMEHTKGYSLLQFIETSSIVGHFSEGKRSIYMNIFSCKPFSMEKASAFTKEFFKADKITVRSIVRE